MKEIENEQKIKNNIESSTKPAKELKPVSGVYVLPAIILAGLLMVFSVFMFKGYSDVGGGKMVSGNAEAWAFTTLFVAIVAQTIYAFYFAIVFALRTKKIPSKSRRIASIWILAIFAGQIGMHDFFRKKVLFGVAHVIISIAIIVCFSIGVINKTDGTFISIGVLMFRINLIWAIVEAIIETGRIKKESDDSITIL